MAELDREPDARDYFRMVWRKRRVIALVVGVAVLASVGASLANPPAYAASATMVLQDQSADPFTQTTQVLNRDRLVQTELEVFSSSLVKDRVRELIGVAPAVNLAALGQTDAFSVTARGPEPRQAADIANAYAQAYIDVTRSQAKADLEAGAEQLSKKVADLQRQINVIDASGPPTPNTTQARASLINQVAVYQQKLDEIEVSTGLQQGRASVATPATPDGQPVAPRPLRSAVLALVLGLILGLGTALLLEYLDDSITSKEALEAALGGAPVLGLIPADSSSKEARPHIVTLDAPSSPGAEAYRSLRTAVQFLGLERDHSVVQVTSPRLGDGKTTTAVNLAVSLAKGNLTVAIVCCDLRRPRLHEFFGLDNAVGLTSVITKEVALDDALQVLPDLDGLSVLASGPLPPNPAEVLATRHMGEVIGKLRDRFDVVVLDTPPLLPVTDAAVLAPWADVVLVVARAGVTGVHDVERAYETLLQVQASPAGSVFNSVTHELGGYGYGYGYGTAAPRAER